MATEGSFGCQLRIENDDKYRRELVQLFKTVRSQATSNKEYFQNGKSSYAERFADTFALLLEHLERGIEPGVDTMLMICHEYDFDTVTPYNGYRSMVKVVHKCVLKILQLSRHITVNRESFLFRGSHYCKELCAYVSNLGQLRACLYYLQQLPNYTHKGELIPDEDKLSPEKYKIAESLMIEIENLNQEIFYGRCLGFQYCDSMVRPLTTICLVMASFADGYKSSSTVVKLAKSFLGGGNYILDPELRAEKIVSVTRNGDINFCKAFWSIAENSVMHTLPLFICPPVQVDKVILVQPDPFDLPLADGSDTVKITPPCAHTGPGPVNTRLISYQIRNGQERLFPGRQETLKSSANLKPKSDCLIIHCHGGGFVAQSSASHEVYLRSWAKDLDTPIFAIDYSLAPEHPFPRQLEEAFFAYCWALKNAHFLGTTAKKVCLVGDSAGANLVISIAMRAASYMIRIPDGVLSIYGTTLVKYIASPSRILALMDPLLPIGVVSSCLSAYAGVGTAVSDSTSEEIQTPDSLYQSPGVSTNSPEHVRNRTQTSQSKMKTHKSGDSGFHEHSTNPANGMETESEVFAHGDGDDIVKGVNSEKSSMVEEKQDDNVTVSNSEQISADQNTKTADEPKTCDMNDRQTMKLDLKERTKPLHKSTSSPVFVTQSAASHDSGVSRIDEIGALGAPPSYAQVRHFAQSPVQQFKHMPISKNPYMSPLFASEAMLEGICPMHILACQLDPMLDDSVAFAKRLKSLNKEVHLEVLENLPHGFLNFVLISQEAKHGSDVCVQKLKTILRLNEDQVEDFDVVNDEELQAYPEGSEV